MKVEYPIELFISQSSGSLKEVDPTSDGVEFISFEQVQFGDVSIALQQRSEAL